MSLSERNHPEASFIQWLSSKIGKKIGEPIGAGSVGVIFDLGKLVMKVAPFPFHELNPILNKNIEGVAKTYSHGKINVPKQFIVKNEFNEDAVQLGKKTVQLYRRGDYALYYLLMEKLDTSYYDVQADVEMVRDSIERFVWSEVDRDNSDSGLRFLWYHCNDEEMLKRMFDYVSDDMGTTAEKVFSELVVIFRNVKKHYNWKDIHVRQFGRNSKGQLVAFDFDNPNAPVSNFTKHMVAEDQMNETVENTFIAYHGSPQKITQFSDEFVGGVDAADQEGAGIYFTTSPENAAAFGENIYKVRLSGRFLSRQHPKEDVDVEELVQLIKMQDGWEDDAQNWAEDPEAGAYEAAYSAKEYNDDEAEVFQQIEADFYRDTSVKYVRAMTKLGYDGIITTAPRDYVNHYHIIVFNPAAIEVLEQFDSSLLNENFQQQVKITDEMAEYARQFESDEALLRSGGFDIDMLDRAAHGFSESDMKTIDAKKLGIRWKPDWEQVKLEIKESGLSPEEWAKTIDLSEPIDVRYMEEPDMGYKRGFYVWDGHHRTMAAKILGKTLPCNVEITVNPIGVLAPNMGYDEFVRYVWKQANQNALTESIRMRIKEVVVDKDGNLIGFQSDDEEFSDFHLQWSMWLEEQFGEEIDGFQLYDAHSTGGDWLRDEYQIAVDLYPDNQEKITYTLFKFEEDGERRKLDSQTIKAPRDFVYGSSPDEPWEFVTSNLRKYIKYTTDKGLFLGLFEASVNEGEVQVEFDADYFKERIPFLKSFELQYDPKSSPNSSAPQKVTFFKKKEIENVTVQGEQTITFPRAVVMLDFYYYPYTTNQWDYTFYHMGLECKVLLEDSKEVSSLTNKVMQAAMRLQMEKLSTSHEILVDDGQEFPNSEWDDAINEVNGSLFKLEEYLENFGSGLGDLHEAQVYPFEKRAGNATDRFTYRFDVDGLRYVVDIWHDPRTHKYGQFEVEFSFMGQDKFAGRSKKNLEHLNSVLLTVATIVEKAVQDHKIKYIKIDAALEGGEDGGFMGMEDNIRSKVYKRFLARRYPQGALEGIGRFILIDMTKIFPQVFEGQDASYVDRLWALLNNISDEDITAELERNTTSTDPKVAYINTDAVENDKGMIYMDITVDEYVEAFDIEYENYDTEEEGSESFQSFDQLLSFIQQKFG